MKHFRLATAGEAPSTCIIPEVKRFEIFPMCFPQRWYSRYQFSWYLLPLCSVQHSTSASSDSIIVPTAYLSRVNMLAFNSLLLIALAHFTALVFALPLPGNTFSSFATRSLATSQNTPDTVDETQVASRSLPLPLLSPRLPKDSVFGISGISGTHSLSTSTSLLSALHVRERTFPLSFQWNAPGSQTYIRATLVAFAGDPSILTNMLDGAYQNVLSIIQAHGDGDIVDGAYRWTNNPDGPLGLQIWIRNANNHQLTYGVLGAALKALNEYLTLFGAGMATTLDIYDGVNQVGQGQQDIIPKYPGA